MLNTYRYSISFVDEKTNYQYVPAQEIHSVYAQVFADIEQVLTILADFRQGFGSLW